MTDLTVYKSNSLIQAAKPKRFKVKPKKVTSEMIERSAKPGESWDVARKRLERVLKEGDAHLQAELL